MAEFYAPQFQPPADVLGAYIRGQQASYQQAAMPLQLQQAQQGVQEGGLKLDQLRMAMNWQRSVQQYAQQRMGQDLQGAQGGAQQPGANPGGGVQSGPQAGVSAPAQASGSYNGSNAGPLESTGLLDPNRLRINADVASYSALGKMEDANKPYADMLGIQAAARKDQQERAKLDLTPVADQVHSLLTAGNPEQLVLANNNYKQIWDKYAPMVGVTNPNDPKQMTPVNVRAAATMFHNMEVAAPSMGSIAPLAMPEHFTQVNGPLGSIYQRNDLSGKLDQVKPEEPLKDVIGPDGKPTNMRASAAEGKQPFNQMTFASGQMTGPVGALDSALSMAGISIPGSGRGGQLYIQKLQNLIANNPDQTPEQIANGIRTGQLDFNGAKRSTGQLSSLAAAADVQSRKIEKDLGSLGPIIDKLPGGPSKIANILTNLQKDWTWGGDKDSTEAVGFIKELAGEYAKLVSGSTGMAAPAEGEMKSALGLMQNALTKGGYQGMREFLTTTSQNRRDSVREGLKTAARTGQSVGQGGDHPPDIQSLLNKYK